MNSTSKQIAITNCGENIIRDTQRVNVDNESPLTPVKSENQAIAFTLLAYGTYRITDRSSVISFIYTWKVRLHFCHDVS